MKKRTTLRFIFILCDSNLSYDYYFATDILLISSLILKQNHTTIAQQQQQQPFISKDINLYRRPTLAINIIASRY